MNRTMSEIRNLMTAGAWLLMLTAGVVAWADESTDSGLTVRREDKLRASRFLVLGSAETPLAEGTVWIADSGAHEFVIGEGKMLSAAEAQAVFDRLTGVLDTDSAADTGALTPAKARVLHTLLGAMLEAADERQGSITVIPEGEDVLPPAEPMLGMNLEPVHYWSRAWAFVDLMNQASWHNGSFRAFVDAAGRYPGGPYTVVPANAATVEVSPGKAWDQIKITPHAGFEDGNFRVFLPGFAFGQRGEGTLFHPLYLERLSPFKTLRFMSMQRTGAGQADRWADRPTPSPKRSRREGDGAKCEAPIEYMIALCNELGADPWFCVPHSADDEYVRNFAELVKRALRPDLKVYVEYSNEVWNPQFGQFHWVKQKADAAGRHLYEQVAIEAKHDWDIWLDVFADEPQRVVRVLASQAHNLWHSETAAKTLGPGGFDALAIAAYVGLPRHDADANFNSKSTPDEVFDWLFDKLDGPERKVRKQHADLAKQYGVPLVAYEAGQHVTPFGSDTRPYSALFRSLHEHPRMYDLIIANLEQWRELGGGMYCAFGYMGPNNRSGAWGHLEFQDQPLATAPKYRALIDYAKRLQKERRASAGGSDVPQQAEP